MVYITKEDCYKVIDVALEELERRREVTKNYTVEELKQNGKCKGFNMMFFAINRGLSDIMQEVYELYDA